jgi:ribosomal protein L18E
MPTAEQHALTQKAEEYEQKAREETDPFTKKALEAVAREYRQRAAQTKRDE